MPPGPKERAPWTLQPSLGLAPRKAVSSAPEIILRTNASTDSVSLAASKITLTSPNAQSRSLSSLKIEARSLPMKVMQCALHTTSTKDVQSSSARKCTSAHFVERLAALRSAAPDLDLFANQKFEELTCQAAADSPLQHCSFQFLLKASVGAGLVPRRAIRAFEHIPNSIRCGFMTGLEKPLQNSFICRERVLDDTLRAAVDAEIGKELDAGFLFQPAELPSSLFCSPITAIEKSTPGKYRTYVDFSSPYASSTPSRNSLINKPSFSSIWFSWKEIQEFMRTAARASMLVSIIDIKSYFRQIPITSESIPHLFTVHRNVLYANRRLPLGLTSAPDIAGNLGDAVTLLMRAVLGLEAMRWVDDFAIAKAKAARANLQDVRAFFAFLGLPLAEEEKIFDFARACVFFGFEWDLDAETISLPAKKLEKYRKRLSVFLTTKAVTKNQTDKLAGCLQHICLLEPELASRLTELNRFEAGWASEKTFVPHQWSRRPHLEAELAFWKKRLDQPFVASLQEPARPVLSWDLFTDASDSGLGIWVNAAVAHWPLRADWKSSSNDDNIGTAEAWAVELLLVHLQSCAVKGFRLRAGVDNNGVLEGWDCRKSRNRPTNASLVAG